MENTQCSNCLKVFKYKSQLERHILSLRTCKKVIIDENGNIISEKKFKCDDCGELFSYERSLDSHIKKVCKKNIPTTNNTTTTTSNITNTDSNVANTVNDNSTNINNSIASTNIDNSIAIKTYNSNNFAINIGVLNENLKPKDEFKIIDDNFITIKNIEKFIGIFYKDKVEINIENMIPIVRDILLDKYVNDISIKDRNIMTISSRYKMHYYKDGEWKHDSCYIYFNKNCVEKILYQMTEAVLEKMFVIGKIQNNNIPFIKSFDLTVLDNDLREIILSKRYNIQYNIVDENLEENHSKKLTERYEFYNNIQSVLINPVTRIRVLAIMKDKMHVDNELRKILSSVPIKTSLPVKEL